MLVNELFNSFCLMVIEFVLILLQSLQNESKVSHTVHILHVGYHGAFQFYRTVNQCTLLPHDGHFQEIVAAG